MGVQDMLAVLFGIDEVRAGKAVQKNLQAQLAYMDSPAGQKEGFGAAAVRQADAHLHASRVWLQLAPEDRLWPSDRDAAGQEALAQVRQLGPSHFRNAPMYMADIKVECLYEAVFAGDEHGEYLEAHERLAALSGKAASPVLGDREFFEECRAWLVELRTKYGLLGRDLPDI